MPKNEVKVKKIPSGINIVINNSNTLNNTPKRRKKRYVKKEDVSTSDQTNLTSSTNPMTGAGFKGTPFSLYSSSFRRPPQIINFPIPPNPSTLPAPPAAPPALPPPPVAPALPPPPHPGFESVQLLETLGNFGNNLLQHFSNIRPQTGSVQIEDITNDSFTFPSSASVQDVIIPDNVIDQIPNITEEQQRELRDRNTKIQAKRQGTMHGNKGIEPQGPYKDMEEYIQAYQTATANREINQERKKKILRQKNQKMYEKGKKDAEDGEDLRHPNNEDYMRGYNEFVDNLAYEEFVAQGGVEI